MSTCRESSPRKAKTLSSVKTALVLKQETQSWSDPDSDSQDVWMPDTQSCASEDDAGQFLDSPIPRKHQVHDRIGDPASQLASEFEDARVPSSLKAESVDSELLPIDQYLTPQPSLERLVAEPMPTSRQLSPCSGSIKTPRPSIHRISVHARSSPVRSPSRGRSVSPNPCNVALAEDRVHPLSPNHIFAQNRRLGSLTWHLGAVLDRQQQRIRQQEQHITYLESRLSELETWIDSVPRDRTKKLALLLKPANDDALRAHCAFLNSITVQLPDPSTPPAELFPLSPRDTASPYDALKAKIKEYTNNPDEEDFNPFVSSQVMKTRRQICWDFKALRGWPLDKLRKLRDVDWNRDAEGWAGRPANLRPPHEDSGFGDSDTLEAAIWRGAPVKPTTQKRPPGMDPAQYKRLLSKGIVDFEIGRDYSD
ncbi:hypothetical protein FISHEDRAFT_79128 [Fistulina hepatica ATCC 64428]|uniref:Uncharacterized protein n=1 Tax=Fistulina hepatica ATCC 64428 TaxID=1128425 RepID=A0A0D7A1J7_9AGAR|nr:hypothetical protein FISHEDRAFT_79128 [Fistulina hepatica ATCC 64428]